MKQPLLVIEENKKKVNIYLFLAWLENILDSGNLFNDWNS
jgi:hypothetical protein